MALHTYCRSLVLATYYTLSALVLSASSLQTSSLINKQASPLINKRPRTFATLTTTTNGCVTESVVRGGGGSNDNFSLLDTPADAFFALAAKGEASTKMSVAKTFPPPFSVSVALVRWILWHAIAGCIQQHARSCSYQPRFDQTYLCGSSLSHSFFVYKPLRLSLQTFAALFPVALFLCLQVGAQLFTGNTATMSAWFESFFVYKLAPNFLRATRQQCLHDSRIGLHSKMSDIACAWYLTTWG
jgi:hypothetical protein